MPIYYPPTESIDYSFLKVLTTKFIIITLCVVIQITYLFSRHLCETLYCASVVLSAMYMQTV